MIIRFFRWLFCLGEPYILTPVEFGATDDSEYFVMMRVESGSLRSLKEATTRGLRIHATLLVEKETVDGNVAPGVSR